MIDAETELAEAEADWDERRALLKLPITSSGDYASLQWARISAWFAVLGIPLLLIFANPYYAGGFSVMFGLLSLG